MKKLIGSLFLLTMLFSLSACGNEATQTDTSAGESTSVQSEDDYYGSWEAVSYKKDNVTATVESLENSDDYTLSHTGLILREDGQYYFYTPFNDETAEWYTTEDGINADGDEIKFNNNQLALNINTNEVYYFEKVSEDTTFPEDRIIDSDYFYGTWSLIAGYDGSSTTTYTLAQLKDEDEANGEVKLIFSDDGKASIKTSDDSGVGEWTYDNGTMQVGNTELTLKDNLLYVPLDDGDILIFEHTSDDQTITETSSEESSEESSDTSSESGLRPEFKEAMDSYEEFYDQYCEILQQYKENPTDTSILTKYMDLLGQLSDMDAKFKVWENEDLNTEEAQYYLDVSNRILQKTLEVAE